MGSIDDTSVHTQISQVRGQVSSLHTRVSVLETAQKHADDQREAMSETLKSVQSGVVGMRSDLSKHALDEEKERNKHFFYIITTLVGVLITLGVMILKNGT